MHAPSKYREYIEYIKHLRNEGTVYRKEIVDELIERFIEVLDDNYYIREIYAGKKAFPRKSIYDEDKISPLIVSVQGEGEVSDGALSAEEDKSTAYPIKNNHITEKGTYVLNMERIKEKEENTTRQEEIQHAPQDKDRAQKKGKKEDKTEETSHAAVKLYEPNEKVSEKVSDRETITKKKLLKIKEELSEMSAYAISLLLIGAQIEDFLYETI